MDLYRRGFFSVSALAFAAYACVNDVQTVLLWLCNDWCGQSFDEDDIIMDQLTNPTIFDDLSSGLFNSGAMSMSFILFFSASELYQAGVNFVKTVMFYKNATLFNVCTIPRFCGADFSTVTLFSDLQHELKLCKKHSSKRS